MSLLATRLLEARASGNLDKFEDRVTNAGAFDFMRQDGENPMGIITDEMRTLARQAFSRDLKVPVIDFDGGISIGGTRSHTIADSENTSDLVTITFVTYVFGFTQVPVLFRNNEVREQEDFNRKLLKYLNLLHRTVDTAAISAIDTAKTQVIADDLGYTVASNVVNFTLAQENQALGELTPMQNSNDFYDTQHLILNQGGHSLIRRLDQEGGQQAVNRALQYADNPVHISNRISNAVGKKLTGYMINEGSTGLLYRFDREAEAGTVSEYKGYTWGIEQMPILNIPMGTLFYEDVGDYSGIAGAASADMKAVRKNHFGFSVDIAYVVASNSDPATIASPIIKFDVADS